MIDQDLINKLSDAEKFCLQGYMITKDKNLAYVCSRTSKVTAKETSLKTQVSRWYQSKPVQEWIKQYNETHRIKQELSPSTDEAMTREELIKSLTLTIRDTTVDQKTKADVGLKLATLENWKKAEGESNDDDKIKYYLPLKCNQCPMYIEKKNQLTKNK
ncbi:MAG: hypothetical protein ACK5KL_02605 [Dysgonomonas sp.]